MSVEILLISVLVGITLLAYMIAINSHGPTRLSISYLFATLILAGTVFMVVQHVNRGMSKERFMELEKQKELADKRVEEQKKKFAENKKRLDYANKVEDVIISANDMATTILNTNVKDMSVSLDVLIGRANKSRSDIKAIQNNLDKVAQKNPGNYFNESIDLVKEALKTLEEAAKFWWLYFRSEDSAQEQLRIRLMRSKATEAKELLQKAKSKLSVEGL